jgi:hypothetical protein
MINKYIYSMKKICIDWKIFKSGLFKSWKDVLNIELILFYLILQFFHYFTSNKQVAL